MNDRPLTSYLDEIRRKARLTEPDLRKFENGNRAAGIRVRWVLQEIRELAFELRQEIRKIKNKRRDAKRDKDKELPKS